MEIKYGLILSAGRGTRMGEVGKVLPKVLWPVFEKTLLELQIAHVKKLGCKKIFINTHHQADLVHDYIEMLADPNITVLHEEELLDSGGAIHNVVKQIENIRDEYLLTINGDHFIFFEDDVWVKVKREGLLHDVTLLALPVDKSNGYNQIRFEKNMFCEVVKNKDAPKNFHTYAGVSIIKMDKLEFVNGPSKFFGSVANADSQDVGVFLLKKYEEWDFGTSDHYLDSLFRMLSSYKENSLMNDFCKVNNVFAEKKINQKACSYATEHRGVCNFTNKEISQISRQSVVIEGRPAKDLGAGIYFNLLFSKK